MEVNPLSIILVKSDSKGDRLLFRYPYAADTQNVSSAQNKRRNPYSMIIVEDLLQNPVPQTSNINKGKLGDNSYKNLISKTDDETRIMKNIKFEACFLALEWSSFFYPLYLKMKSLS